MSDSFIQNETIARWKKLSHQIINDYGPLEMVRPIGRNGNDDDDGKDGNAQYLAVQANI